MRLICSPYSRKENSAKNYPHWQELIKLLVDDGHYVIQVGVGDEPKLDGCLHVFDKKLPELEEMTREVGYFIAVDNFFHHMAYSCGVNGVVLWGPSDPLIFGYESQLNILKSREYLRKDQYGFYRGYVWPNRDKGWHGPRDVYAILFNRQQNN